MRSVLALVVVAALVALALAGDNGSASAPGMKLKFPDVSAADLVRLLLVTLVVQIFGFLWYGPFFSELYVRVAFGSLANFKKIEKATDKGYHFDYRRSMLGAWFGSFSINFGLLVFLSLLGVTSFVDAYLVALLAAVVMAGSSALHDFWRGSSIGVVIFDQAFNAVAFPLAAVLLLAIKPLL